MLVELWGRRLYKGNVARLSQALRVGEPDGEDIGDMER
jgi:hypothetical protein